MKQKIKVVPEIKIKGYPVGECGYEEAHTAANQEELRQHGKKKFHALKKIIDKKIPVDELAGSHTKTGTILVSKKIPAKYHKEIVTHEKYEHELMKVGEKIRRSRRNARRMTKRRAKGRATKGR